MKTTPNASSSTDCTEQPLLFQDLDSRQVVVDFSGGLLSSDGGVLLLRQVDRNLGLTQSLAECFWDGRNQLFVDHSVRELLAQRILGLALGYEDLNDHDQLRRDPLLASACDKRDPLGEDRFNPSHRGFALAGSSTLNRLELSNNRKTRCHKLRHDPVMIEDCLLRMGVRCLPKHAPEIVIDLDAMGHLLHGDQEGRHFNAHYDSYCYLPLYVFVGHIPLWAQLRTSEHDASTGTVAALKKIVAAIRKRCRRARIIVRGDSGFCREEIMAWCEAPANAGKVYYCLGLAKNCTLIDRLDSELANARLRHCLTGTNVRVFGEFEYQTVRSWSRSRWVIGKAEVGLLGDNPRFIVTNLAEQGVGRKAGRKRLPAERLYEEVYCARGEMENQLKQQTLDLQADRMSTHYLASNQLRLWLATFAYLLMERLRELGLAGTDLARATVGTVRLKVLKIAAQVQVSVRRVYVKLNSAYPWQIQFRHCHRQLMALPLGCG
jgi:hypothetical protein